MSSPCVCVTLMSQGDTISGSSAMHAVCPKILSQGCQFVRVISYDTDGL